MTGFWYLNTFQDLGLSCFFAVHVHTETFIKRDLVLSTLVPVQHNLQTCTQLQSTWVIPVKYLCESLAGTEYTWHPLAWHCRGLLVQPEIAHHKSKKRTVITNSSCVLWVTEQLLDSNDILCLMTQKLKVMSPLLNRRSSVEALSAHWCVLIIFLGQWLVSPFRFIEMLAVQALLYKRALCLS